MKKKKIPRSAMLFDASRVSLDFTNGSPTLSMVAYSGKLIERHHYWGSLIFDLSGIKFLKNKYPILVDHDTEKKVAYMGKPIVNNDLGLVVDPSNVHFLDTEHSKDFIKLAQEGFPFEASVYMIPTKVEEISSGEKAVVNGIEVTGEAVIWRESIFKEASICVFGADGRTSSSVFSEDGECIDVDYYEKTKGEDGMEITVGKLKADHPDIVKQIQDDAVAEAKERFSAEKEKLEGVKKSLEDANVKFSDRLAYLEKQNIIRTEKDIKEKAFHIFMDKLESSDISKRLYPKVMNQVDHNKFIEGSKLDETKFSEAVDAEIKDWIDSGVGVSVIGGGVSVKTGQNNKMSLSDVDSAVGRMLEMVGQKV